MPHQSLLFTQRARSLIRENPRNARRAKVCRAFGVLGGNCRTMRLPAVLVLASIAFRPPDADACSGPVPCSLPVPPELKRSGVPSNAPAIVAERGSYTQDAGAELLTADGGVVALSSVTATAGFTAWTVILKPAAALVEGETYVLRSTCEPSGATVLEPFVAHATAPLPTDTGTLAVVTTGRKTLPLGGGSTCSIPTDAAYVQLKITPSPALAPFAAVTAWTLEVDGVAWASERFGGVAADGTPETYRPWPEGPVRRVDLVYAVCKSNASMPSPPGISPGTHTAALRARLAGGATLTAAEASFTLDCGGLAPGCGCGTAFDLPLGLAGLGLLFVRRRAHGR